MSFEILERLLTKILFILHIPYFGYQLFLSSEFSEDGTLEKGIVGSRNTVHQKHTTYIQRRKKVLFILFQSFKNIFYHSPVSLLAATVVAVIVSVAGFVAVVVAE